MMELLNGQIGWTTIRQEAGEIVDASPRDVAWLVLRRLGVTKPPVPIFAILQRLGVKTFKASNLSVHGISDSRKDPPTVWVNARDATVNQRFSAAHELGHILLHPRGYLFREDTYNQRTPMEREANEFAAHLLMPLDVLEPMAVDAGLSTSQLAEKFMVSNAAMSWQLSKLL